MKKLGFKVIDFENDDQIKILEGELGGSNLKGYVPSVRLNFGVEKGLQYLNHHRIMAAKQAGLPIVVELSKIDTFN